MDILDHIPYGRKNAKSRFMLASELGISERLFRDLVAEINTSGRAVILADTKAGGYYRPQLPEDSVYYSEYLRQEESRCIALHKKIRAMKGNIPDPNQMTLFEA